MSSNFDSSIQTIKPQHKFIVDILATIFLLFKQAYDKYWIELDRFNRKCDVHYVFAGRRASRFPLGSCAVSVCSKVPKQGSSYRQPAALHFKQSAASSSNSSFYTNVRTNYYLFFDVVENRLVVFSIYDPK